MKRSRFPLIAVPIVALLLIGVFWFYTGPDQNPYSTIPDEETPLGAPAQLSSKYEGGYGITWTPDVSGGSTAFLGYTGNQYEAKLIVSGTSGSNETLAPGMTREDAEKILGSPISSFNRVRISSLSSPGKSYYSLGNDIYILYFDNMDHNKIVFVLRVSNDLASKTQFFTSSALDPYSLTDTETMAMDLLNAVRASYGKSPLKKDLQLTAMARGHSQSMVSSNYFSHDSPAGQTMRDRLKAAGITARNAGEALCAGTWTPMDAVISWVNSPPHRDIILGDYTSGGIGIATGNSTYGIYYTLNVIKN